MSIRLEIEAVDVEVEGLLAYLESQSLHPEDKIFLLERGLRWLRVSEPKAFDLNANSASVHLALSENALAPVVPVHTQTERFSGDLSGQANRR